MKARYLGILAVSVALAVAMTLWGGSAGRRSSEAHGPADSAPSRPVEVALGIEPDGTVTPAAVSVEKGRRVHVAVTNHGETPARLELPGYDDKIPAATVGAGETWTAEFIADRPGEDFAWVVNGAPASRFLVTGSHLIEGHR